MCLLGDIDLLLGYRGFPEWPIAASKLTPSDCYTPEHSLNGLRYMSGNVFRHEGLSFWRIRVIAVAVFFSDTTVSAVNEQLAILILANISAFLNRILLGVEVAGAS